MAALELPSLQLSMSLFDFERLVQDMEHREQPPPVNYHNWCAIKPDTKVFLEIQTTRGGDLKIAAGQLQEPNRERAGRRVRNGVMWEATRC
jgi:hypothetical protein